jgi:hypothetical protein
MPSALPPQALVSIKIDLRARSWAIAMDSISARRGRFTLTFRQRLR